MDRGAWQATIHGGCKRVEQNLATKQQQPTGGKDLTEAEEIKKRWQKYTEELHEKVLMTGLTMTVWALT